MQRAKPHSSFLPVFYRKNAKAKNPFAKQANAANREQRKKNRCKSPISSPHFSLFSCFFIPFFGSAHKKTNSFMRISVFFKKDMLQKPIFFRISTYFCLSFHQNPLFSHKSVLFAQRSKKLFWIFFKSRTQTIVLQNPRKAAVLSFFLHTTHSGSTRKRYFLHHFLLVNNFMYALLIFFSKTCLFYHCFT